MPRSEIFQKQILFSELLARLIWELRDMGYLVTMGECWRSPEAAALYAKEGKGIANSLHCDRLACDLNLFTSQGVLLSTVEEYRPAGEKWKSYGSTQYETIWGGDFKSRPDADHFSIRHEGRG